MSATINPPEGSQILRVGHLPLTPDVVLLPDFLPHSVCDDYIKRGKRMAAFTSTKLTSDGQSIVDKSFRDCTYRAPGNEHFPELEAAVRAITDWPEFEEFSLQHYETMGMVNNHQDCSPGLEHQRYGTIIVYLNDVRAGGETVFPKMKLTVEPKKGDALFFNYTPGETVSSMHRGQKVLKGEKWIITCWFIKKETK